MSIKSILCAYSGEAARGSGMRHAMMLARHHKAYLTGVLSRRPSQIVRQFGTQIPRILLDQLQDAEAERVSGYAERFAEAARAAGLGEHFDFVDIEPSRDGSLTDFARSYDLVVTGLHSTQADEEHWSAHPDLIALRSGRPILVVPNGYSADGPAERVVVAWDGKRSAARAIGDAMDVLAEKAHVTVLSVGEQPANTDRLVENMLRHGVTVDAKQVARKGSVSATVRAEAEAEGARLIVMGAFEHSKFSHDLVGGVTTDVMRDATVPVFMSH